MKKFKNRETNSAISNRLVFSLVFFSTVLSLQELCCRTIVRKMRSVYSIDTLPLPNPVKSHLKSYALTTTTSAICPNNNILVNTAKNITCKSHHSSKFSAKNNCSISWSRWKRKGGRQRKTTVELSMHTHDIEEQRTLSFNLRKSKITQQMRKKAQQHQTTESIARWENSSSSPLTVLQLSSLESFFSFISYIHFLPAIWTSWKWVSSDIFRYDER